MYCNKCGNKVEDNQQYCNKCGNRLTDSYTNQELNNYTNSDYKAKVKTKKKTASTSKVLLIMCLILVIIVAVCVMLFNRTDNYYFNEEKQEEIYEPVASSETTTTKGKYKTAIITDNVYSGIKINTTDDAKKLISNDSTEQKKSDYPKEIIQIENDIIKNYSITAVNLREMDIEFAKELENVIKNIYDNYPKARGYLTNLTLTNLNMSEASVIALFMPVFKFGTSNSSTTTPWVIKTQVQLNAKYFLNPERITMAVEVSSKAGHFPKNATKYSPVAHEFGHYLSFIAMLNHYQTKSILVVNEDDVNNFYEIIKDFGEGNFSKQMLEEAYQNYTMQGGTADFDSWRGQISEYALAKDEAGEYIYDETVAEAFHDVYLNGENANQTSKLITQVLKKYIEG